MAGRKRTGVSEAPERTLFDFDAARSAELKEAGMALAAENKAGLLAFARALAVAAALARPDRCVSADDVQRALAERGVSVRALGNSAGSIFKGKCWRFTGRRVKSSRAHAHRNELKVWEYVGADGQAEV